MDISAIDSTEGSVDTLGSYKNLRTVTHRTLKLAALGHNVKHDDTGKNERA